jgi:hypothetical protein
VGEQLREVGVVGTTRLTVVEAETLLRVAVRVALWLLLNAAVVAAKVAVVDPAPTVTEACTVSVLFVFPSVTVTPPVGAA